MLPVKKYWNRPMFYVVIQKIIAAQFLYDVLTVALMICRLSACLSSVTDVLRKKFTRLIGHVS